MDLLVVKDIESKKTILNTEEPLLRHKLNEYNSGTKFETIKHSNRNKDNKRDREK
jgi:hypothetical protein